jgi:hypothetical protein
MSQIKAYFTTNERHKTTYGTTSERISSHSIVCADVCRLCFTRAEAPVTCDHGHVFCRTHLVEFLAEHAATMAAAAPPAMAATPAGVAPDAATQRGIYHPADMALRVMGSEAPGSKRARMQDPVPGTDTAAAAAAAVTGDAAAGGGKPASSSGGPDGPTDGSAAAPRRAAKFALRTPCPLSPSVVGDATGDGSRDHAVRVSRLQSVIFPAAGDGCPQCGGDVVKSLRPVAVTPCGHIVCHGCAEKFLRDPANSSTTDATAAAKVNAENDDDVDLENTSAKKKSKRSAKSKKRSREIGRCPTCDAAATGTIDLMPGGSALAARHGSNLISTMHSSMAL